MSLKNAQYWQQVVSPGDRGSALAHEICLQSYGNCEALHVVPHQSGNFRGSVGYLWQKWILEELQRYRFDACGDIQWSLTEHVQNDGAGGKPQFFSLIGTPVVFSRLGWEIIVMCADDEARFGNLPCLMINCVDAKRLTDKNFHLFESMMRGYGEALRQARLVNITGELAIMKHSITAFCDTGSEEQLVLTWGGACIGLSRRDLFLNGSKIRSGMHIVGFWEPGYRCNGGTFFTNLIMATWGPEVQKILSNPDALEFVYQLTMPSQSYARTLTRLLGWHSDGTYGEPKARIRGVAHITGGGVWSKFRESLPEGVGAVLDCMPEPAPVLLQAQKLSESTDFPLSDLEAYGTLHGGCGMLLVCDPEDTGYIIAEARRDGVRASKVGSTVSSHERLVRVKSRFSQGEWLSSDGLENQ